MDKDGDSVVDNFGTLEDTPEAACLETAQNSFAETISLVSEYYESNKNSQGFAQNSQTLFGVNVQLGGSNEKVSLNHSRNTS